MPRCARIILKGLPHHITQRGSRQQSVFFTNQDREAYLGWLCHYAEVFGVDVLGYCLMTNHVHLLLVPHEVESLHLSLKAVHTAYALRINKRNNWVGHLWQNRYFSSPLDKASFKVVARYIERNPVRAGILQNPSAYPWSSAAAHCGFQENPHLNTTSVWNNEFKNPLFWKEWLNNEDSQTVNQIRGSNQQNKPYVSEEFASILESELNTTIRVTSRGRPKKVSVPITNL